MTQHDYSDGSYTLFDEGCRGDVFAVVPRTYSAPAWLTEYFDLATALREATKTCSLQQGVCWIVRARDVLPRCGQRCGRGECEDRSSRSSGLGRLSERTTIMRGGTVRREVALAWQPVASVSTEGVAVVKDGCVLPLWQRIFVSSPASNFFVQGPSETYRAAVRAAMELANLTNIPRIVYGWGCGGRPVPVVYVHPGGLVRSAPAASARESETRATLMDSFEYAQALAASRGASLMPFNM